MKTNRIIYVVLCLFVFSSISFSKDPDMTGEKAPFVSLFKLEDNKYFRTKNLKGKKDIVLSFLPHGVVLALKRYQNYTNYLKIWRKLNLS